MICAVQMPVMVQERKTSRSPSVWVIEALKTLNAGPLSPRSRRKVLRKQWKTVNTGLP